MRQIISHYLTRCYALKLACLALLLFSLNTKLAADDIILAGDPWCPFTCAANSENKGILVDVAKILLESSGHKVSYLEHSWARALKDTREDKITAVAGALKNDAPDFVFPKSSWAQQKSCFYVKRGNAWKYNGADSLKSQKIGAVQDYSYGDPFDSLAQKALSLDLVSGTGTTTKLFKKLIDDRVSVIIEDESVAKFVLANDKSLNADMVTKAGCLSASPLYVAFGPNNPKAKDYAKLLDAAFKKFKSSPKLKEIYSHYGM